MNETRKLHISFKATSANVDMVRAAVSGVCIDFFHLDCNAAIVMDFCLIVTELMNNVVEHSQADSLEAEIRLSGQKAVFVLISTGECFDPTRSAAMPDVEHGELPEGGYGLALIQALADCMEYERQENRNIVTLCKTFPEK